VTTTTPTDRIERFLADAVPHLDCPVFLPGDTGYDEERAGFNLATDRNPAVIVGARGAADVMAAVRFAGTHGLPVGVLATGHTPTVPADGAVLISTRRMQGLHIDPLRGTARVEAGVRWDRVIREAGQFGLAPLNGSSPTVGVVGYTLGGGIGPMARTQGYAADRVLGLDVVTADGAFRVVDHESDPDLYWGLLGGKSNLGVVTSMEFELVGLSRLYGGGLYFPGESAAAVLRTYQYWVTSMPEEMSSSLALLRLPPDPALPEQLRGRFVVHVRIAYVGSEEEGARLVQPLRYTADLILDTVAEMPYTDVATIHNDPVDAMPLLEHNGFLHGFDEAAVTAVLEVAGPDTDSPLILVEVRHLGGALARRNGPPNAVGNRDAAFLFLGVGIVDPSATGPVADQLDLLFKRMAPWSTGKAYTNFLAARDTAPERVRDAYDDADYDRLVAIKTAYDPTNMFRINHNIPPATED
jgi:FAD/FMN-containing dehydrogenase